MGALRWISSLSALRRPEASKTGVISERVNVSKSERIATHNCFQRGVHNRADYNTVRRQTIRTVDTLPAAQLRVCWFALALHVCVCVLGSVARSVWMTINGLRVTYMSVYIERTTSMWHSSHRCQRNTDEIKHAPAFGIYLHINACTFVRIRITVACVVFVLSTGPDQRLQYHGFAYASCW